MNEKDKQSKDAVDLIKEGKIAEAQAIIDKLSSMDPRPLFFWLARAELARIKGDKKKQATWLWRFNCTLNARLLKALGFTKLGNHTTEDLTKNAPLEIAEAKLAADIAWRAGDFDSAIPLFQKSLEIQIADLKKLGDDIYA